jgi:YVTN family beta-propeller protein
MLGSSLAADQLMTAVTERLAVRVEVKRRIETRRITSAGLTIGGVMMNKVRGNVLSLGLLAVLSVSAPTFAEEASPISDGAHGGTEGFYFLPPMVNNPAVGDTFDAALQPVVEICATVACDEFHASYSMTEGSASEVVRLVEEDEHYIVNWHTRVTGAVAGQTYRVRVMVSGMVLGHADVAVVRTAREAVQVKADAAIALVANQTLPLKFRIEPGIAGEVVVSPSAATINVGETQQFSAALYDLHGEPLAGPVIMWSSHDTGVATMDADGLATGEDDGTATITASSGPSSGSALLKVTRLTNLQGFAYVAHFTGNISVINAAHAVVATIPDAPLSYKIAITPDGTRAYVTHAGSGDTVSVINTASNTLVGSIFVGTRPLGIAMSADGSHVYVANEVSKTVSVISTAANSVVKTIPVALSGANDVALNPSGTHLLVGGCLSSVLSVINTVTNLIEKTIPVPYGCSGAIAFLHGGTHAYVQNGSSLLRVNTVTNAVDTVLSGLPSCSASSLAITPDGTRAYLASPGHSNCGVANTVRVFDTATHTLTGTITVGNGPVGIAITPNGERVYVTNTYSNSVSIIRTSDNVVIGTIGVGTAPQGIALR